MLECQDEDVTLAGWQSDIILRVGWCRCYSVQVRDLFLTEVREDTATQWLLPDMADESEI